MAPFEVFCALEYIHKKCHCFFGALVLKISTPSNEEKLWMFLFTKNYKSYLFNSVRDWKSLQTETCLKYQKFQTRPSRPSWKLFQLFSRSFVVHMLMHFKNDKKIIYWRFYSSLISIGFCSYTRIIWLICFACIDISVQWRKSKRLSCFQPNSRLKIQNIILFSYWFVSNDNLRLKTAGKFSCFLFRFFVPIFINIFVKYELTFV